MECVVIRKYRGFSIWAWMRSGRSWKRIMRRSRAMSPCWTHCWTIYPISGTLIGDSISFRSILLMFRFFQRYFHLAHGIAEQVQAAAPECRFSGAVQGAVLDRFAAGPDITRAAAVPGDDRGRCCRGCGCRRMCPAAGGAPCRAATSAARGLRAAGCGNNNYLSKHCTAHAADTRTLSWFKLAYNQGCDPRQGLT